MKHFLAVFICSIALYAQTTATNSVTLTSSQMFGVILGTPSSGSTYTLPTAANLCQTIPPVFGGMISPSVLGNSNPIFFAVVNLSATALNTITVSPGVGITTSGTLSVAANSSRLFFLFPISCVHGSEAWRLVSLGGGTI